MFLWDALFLWLFKNAKGSEKVADKAHRLTDEKLEEMEKRLSAIYSRAEKEIQKTADEYFSKFAKQDEDKRKLLEQGKITEDEYKKWRKGKVMYGKRFTEMKEQCAKQLLNVNQTALAYVNGELPEVYALNYNALAGSVDGVGGYSFTLVDADTVRNLAVTDTSLLPYKEIDPKKDIPWNMKKINAETLQGILQGESMDKIAKRLRNVQEMNKTQAIRSARTIVTGAENKGRQDSYARAEADGIILQKEWLSTNDGRTRHSHAMLDGAIVDQDKKFENGLMYPGDPSGRPEEVYNCRCTLVAKVNGFKKVQVQKAMAEKQVEEPQTTAFTPAKTTEEAQQYADRFVSTYKSSLTGQVDYGGIQLSYANEMNRAFTEVFDAYDTPYPLRNIKPFNTREKRFKGTTAEAAYQWGLNDMFYNKAYYKSAKAFNDHLAEYNKLLQTVLPNIDVAIARTKPGASLRYLEALKRTGRTNVFAPDAYGSTIHEMGHYLDDQIFRKAFKEKGFDLSASFEKYSGGISGYATATQQEYIAESFAAYWKGETDILDPDLIDIFKGLRKK